MLQHVRHDIKKYNSTIKHKDLVYLIGLLFIILIGILKELVYFMENKKYNEEKVNPVHIELISNLKGSNLKSCDNTGLFTPYGTADYYRKNANKLDMQNYKEDISSPAIFLRNYLINNNFELNGSILKTRFPRIPEDKLLDFCKGEYDKPYMVQYITFGKEIDLAISKLFGNKVTKSNKYKSTYLTLNDSDVLQLKEDIKNVFMITELKMKFVDKEPKKV